MGASSVLIYCPLAPLQLASATQEKPWYCFWEDRFRGEEVVGLMACLIQVVHGEREASAFVAITERVRLRNTAQKHSCLFKRSRVWIFPTEGLKGGCQN